MQALKLPIALICLMLILVWPASAQRALTGIAISQAPEAAVGVCFGEDAAQTIACAQNDCMAKTGFDAIDCPVTDWCFPAGWTVDIFLQHQEGPHWHEYSCGWQSREQAEAAAKIICDVDWVMGCILVRLWSHDEEVVVLD